jgi:hypothetical protein
MYRSYMSSTTRGFTDSPMKRTLEGILSGFARVDFADFATLLGRLGDQMAELDPDGREPMCPELEHELRCNPPGSSASVPDDREHDLVRCRGAHDVIG